MTQEPVGTVAAIYRFPVKSMRGEAVEQASLYWYGLEGDRRYAFVRAGNVTNFPWLTAREVPALLLYAPYFADPGQPRSSAVRVRTPAGEDVPVESDQLRATLEQRHGAPIHLLHLNRGAPDAASVSVITEASVRDLGARLGLPIDARRFRQNIVVRTASGTPYAEEAWFGRRLRFGPDVGAAVRLNRPDGRCMMVNLDPETAVQQASVLREIARTRDTNLGVYGSVEALGSIRVGDPVYID